MEGAHQQLARGLGADEGLDPLAHFGGGLVGEGDGADLRRGQVGAVAGLQQARDLVRDHARLARAGTGQHEAR